MAEGNPTPQRARDERRSGIYVIRCTRNGKSYVGSAVWIEKRWRHHREDLRHDRHHSPRLQHAWNKYGESAFVFDVLELVPKPERLIATEQAHMDRLKTADRRFGFNVNPVAGSNLGRTAGPETRAKISAARRGTTTSAETKAALSRALMGNTNHLGYKPTPENIARIKAARVGKRPALGMKHTEEAKALMSASRKGKTLSEGHRLKIAAALRGKVRSPEHREKTAKSQAKLTPEQAEIVRNLVAQGYTQTSMARRFGVSKSLIGKVLKRVSAAYR